MRRDLELLLKGAYFIQTTTRIGKAIRALQKDCPKAYAVLNDLAARVNKESKWATTT